MQQIKTCSLDSFLYLYLEGKVVPQQVTFVTKHKLQNRTMRYISKQIIR